MNIGAIHSNLTIDSEIIRGNSCDILCPNPVEKNGTRIFG